MHRRFLLVLAAAWGCVGPAAAGPAGAGAGGCTADGAFGIRFGDKPPVFLKPVERNATSLHYVYKPPQPSAQFEQYRILADANGSRIYEVQAFRRLPPTQDSMDRAAKEAARQRAAQVLRDYAASLGQDLDADYQRTEQDPHTWTRRMGEVAAALHGDSPWSAWMSCSHLPLQDAAARPARP